jgi:Cu+-exporting ATPase
MITDPVCGMMVSEETMVAKSEYKGKEYWFCHLNCKKTFDEDPDKYIKETEKIYEKSNL